ncbi:hypothetical protein [Campylobacter hyointestinalis]|uniref:hypothetical protein n=1 Tax=Campylobacter hyointestinalis TaxID=198 RepID=UPI000727C5A4|nr:hypothetical protein [Campylobacter hyointestinalis]CUU92006.1 Uncharacterised protein [Campylobacter hyointestinalis subsp. hyointestinalis]
MQNPFIVAPQSLDTRMQDISVPLLNATNSLYNQQFKRTYTDSLTQESDRKRDLHPFELEKAKIDTERLGIGLNTLKELAPLSIEKARLDNDKLESELNAFNINLANSIDADIYQDGLYEALEKKKPIPKPRNAIEAAIYENFMNTQKSKSHSFKAPINLDIFSQKSNANAKDTTKPPLDLENIPGLIDEGKLLQFTNKTNGKSFYISENELNSMDDLKKAEIFGNDPEMKNYDKSETTVDDVMNSLSGYEDDKPLSINIYNDDKLEKLHYIPISRNDRTTLINTDLQDQAAMSIRNSGEEDLSLDEVINKRNTEQLFKVNKDLESILNNIENGKRRYNEKLKFRNEVKNYNTTVNEVINKYIKDGEDIWKGISTQTDSDARKSGTLSISKAIKNNGLGFQDFKNLAYSKSYDGDNKPIIKLNILSSMLFSDNKVRDFMLKNEPQFIKVLNESKKWLESNDIEFSSDFTNSLSTLVGDLGTAKLLAKSAAKYLTNEDRALKKAKVKLHNAKGTINRQTEGIELKLF